METSSHFETLAFINCRTKLRLGLVLFRLVPFALLMAISTPVRANNCTSIYLKESLTRQDGVKIKNASDAFLRKLVKNDEPAIKHMTDSSSYKAPNIQIFDNRRLYEPNYMLRFNGNRLIKMYRGLAIEEGKTLEMKSSRKKNPIWITPDFEHARLYAAEWTPVENPITTKAIVLEMWIPEFMIYWRNDPRVEGMAEAFILDTDITTLESFVSKIHHIKKNTPKKSEEDSSGWFWDDFYR